ncbi:uncharacterized protein LOC100185749 [Ciona intestinalis]
MVVEAKTMRRTRLSLKCLTFTCVVLALTSFMMKFYITQMQVNSGFDFKDEEEELEELKDWTGKEVSKLNFKSIIGEEAQIRGNVYLVGDEKNEKIRNLRKEHLRSSCVSTKTVTETQLFDFWSWKAQRVRENLRLPRLLVSDQHQVIYCSMEGVNSDIWESLIVSLEEGAGKDNLDLRFAGGPTKRLLWEYNENSIRYRVEKLL